MEKTRKHLKFVFSAKGYEDDDLMIHILGNLTAEYDTLVDMLTKRVGASSDALTLAELTEELAAKYSRLTKSKKNPKQEQALNVSDGGNKDKKKIKGKCWNCGKYGHKSEECRSKKEVTNGNDGSNKSEKSGGGKKFMKCTYCKKSGHTDDHCWKKAADAKKGESANMAKEENVLMCVEIDSDDESVPPPLISRGYESDDSSDDESVPPPLISRGYESDDSSDDESIPPPLISRASGYDTDSSDEEPPKLIKKKENKYFTGIPRPGDRRAYVCFYDSDSDDSDFEEDDDDDESVADFDFNEGMEVSQVFEEDDDEEEHTKVFDFNEESSFKKNMKK